MGPHMYPHMGRSKAPLQTDGTCSIVQLVSCQCHTLQGVSVVRSRIDGGYAGVSAAIQRDASRTPSVNRQRDLFNGKRFE